MIELSLTSQVYWMIGTLIMHENERQNIEKQLAIARPEQFLYQHLLGVGEKTYQLAKKLNLEEAGFLIGLLHDFGKYSQEFQRYIKAIEQNSSKTTSNFGYDEDDDAYDYTRQKGKIDHSSAGAQYLWRTFEGFNSLGHGRVVGQILAICIASHHSGLIDYLNQDGLNFIKRMKKTDEKVHLEECKEACDEIIKEKITSLEQATFVNQFFNSIKPIINCKLPGETKAFYMGMLTKFLFSCLIDADRLDSAGRNIEAKIEWNTLIVPFERAMKKFKAETDIDRDRRTISKNCFDSAKKSQGIYRLTVPTGGGKTFASLRYALHHAEKHNLDRIIYIIPFTSVIEQNAEQIRKILDDETESKWVLEHHSNLEPEQQTWHSKLACENWDKPIVLTTMVQFLEVLFGSGTRGVRRLHQLTNSVLIFDEVQSLPIKCFHLFCNAINFLTFFAKSTVVLCTATQPSLDALQDENKGRLTIPEENELMGSNEQLDDLFCRLSRVDVLNRCETPGWKDEKITRFVLEQFSETNSVLVIVNTKVSTQKLFASCGAELGTEAIFYLSTNLCSAHRKVRLKQIRYRLDNDLPVLCISTQLIEAGVDISFKTVIRYLAGLDSIAQAAGRCNRHAEMGNKKGKVFVIKSATENLGSLDEINVGQAETERVFRELDNFKKQTDRTVLHPEVLKLYFKYYFKHFSKEMAYSLKPSDHSTRPEYDTDILELLSKNDQNGIEDPYEQRIPWLRQAFMTAGKNFAAIDAPTKALIVQYTEGKAIVSDLCNIAKKFEAKKFGQLLRKAQRYTVNIYPNDWVRLQKAKAIHEIQGEGIFYLDEKHYSEEFGVSSEEVSKMSTFML